MLVWRWRDRHDKGTAGTVSRWYQWRVDPEMARQRHDEETAESGDGTTEGRRTERHDKGTAVRRGYQWGEGGGRGRVAEEGAGGGGGEGCWSRDGETERRDKGTAESGDGTNEGR